VARKIKGTTIRDVITLPGDAVWDGCKRLITRTIAEFYPHNSTSLFQPHYNERLLRKSVLDAAPPLRALREQVLEHMAAGSVAVILTDLGLANHIEEWRCLLYGLALAFGFPTPSDQKSGQLLWDVRPKPTPIGREASYSEHSGEADLHTDSQYFEEPEQLAILYAVRRACCGGGVSVFSGMNSILETLHERGDNDSLLGMLHEPIYPFPLYDPYFAATNWEEADARPPVIRRPILADRPRLRFRKDVIEHSFALESTAQPTEARQAFEAFVNLLRAVETTSFLLESDCAVIWNNHEALHGRTAFSDSQRHLIRIRMSSGPVSDQVARFNAEHNG